MRHDAIRAVDEESFRGMLRYLGTQVLKAGRERERERGKTNFGSHMQGR